MLILIERYENVLTVELDLEVWSSNFESNRQK